MNTLKEEYITPTVLTKPSNKAQQEKVEDRYKVRYKIKYTYI